MEEMLAINIIALCLSYFVLAGGVMIHINQDEIIGSTIPAKDADMMIIQTGDGDVYNCVDIYKQPALNHPLLKNHTMQMEPSSYPLDLDIQSIMSSNISEADFPDVKCPARTIPILLNDNSSKAYVPNGLQEEVWPSFSGDRFARFHIRWVDSSNKPCYDFRCPGFVQVSEVAAIGGRITPVSVYNGPQYVITVMLFQDRKTKDWWLARLDKSSAVGFRALGYWPRRLFTSLQEKATFAFWGGWVRGPTVSSDPPPMGSGRFAKEGYRKAAFVKAIKIANRDNNFVNPNAGKGTPVTTRPPCYTVDGFGVVDAGMHAFFGGPGECPS
uniref:Neprosin PEP catalytic domain-containing protein n=1 Tax=Oryza brachyantha TaxID=4533 RepID=J3LHZ5_ORYBR